MSAELLAQKENALRLSAEEMALRDEFAKAALTGHMSADRQCGVPSAVATWCYQIADAMLEERLK